MTILKSFNVPSLLTYSNIQADAVATYVATNSYAVDAEVEYDGRVYVSMADANEGNQPDISPLKWDDDRPANTTALFDDYPSTVSQNIGEDMVLEFDSDDTTLITLGSLRGTVLKLELIDKNTDEQLHFEEISLFEYEEPQDIYDYFFIFNDVEKKVHHIGGFVPYFGATLRITVTQDGDGVSAIGFIQFGVGKKLGCTVRDTVKFSNRSGVELQRIRGKLTLVETVGSTSLSLPVYIADVNDVYPIRRELAKHSGKPLVVLGDDTGANLAYTIVGVYTEIEESITDHGEYTLNMDSMDEII